MVRRIFVEKKQGFDVAAKKLTHDLKEVLGVEAEQIREFLRYDVENIDPEDFNTAKTTVFSEPPVDNYYDEQLPNLEGFDCVVIEFLAGQYDQRADSAMQCVQLFTRKVRPLIKCARIVALKGLKQGQLERVKKYLINPVECREGDMTKPETLAAQSLSPEMVGKVALCEMSDAEVESYHEKNGFAMSKDDLKYVRDYFKTESREPYLTELKVIDTYWSDHCRHTTFATELDKIEIDSNNPHIEKALQQYNNTFEQMYTNRNDKYKCLMDIATIAVKKLKKEGKLQNLDESDEINACSVEADVDIDGKTEKWLIMFKNETHNHPTEIEPFGGAATCLGGAIRDPLSGRTYVYQAMRVTGSGNPLVPVSETIKGKLPQRTITTTAAAGFSSYGNQIGLATGIVSEMYHEGYRAKRLETGYVIAGAPKSNVVRQKPQEGDVIILLGGETGRDGCGGATGSSKAHNTSSLEVCGAEVQKGNPLTERKIQRLFRNKQVANMIIKCNDFGAGGVSVAIGELADSLDIYLDRVPKKYEGLDATELAISESQERMAVVIKKQNIEAFKLAAAEENLGATEVAVVTDSGRMRMIYKGVAVVDLKRAFLDTNGVKQHANAVIKEEISNYIIKANDNISKEIEQKKYSEALLKELSRLNVCSQKGLSERFDSTIGANTVIMPFGGKRQLTPSIVMAAKPPVDGFTDTATVSAYGCYPYLSESTPFGGAIYAILTSVSKQIAAGVPYSSIKLTLQEFFKKLGKDAERWGQPLSALLGAFYAESHMDIAAIGGKDSMSGSFENMDVPPTLISFSMGIGKASKLLTNTFKGGGYVYRFALPKDSYNIPDFAKTRQLYDYIDTVIGSGAATAATVSEEGGAVCAVVKGCMGNEVGVNFMSANEQMFAPNFGDIIIESSAEISVPEQFSDCVQLIAKTDGSKTIKGLGEDICLEKAIAAFENTLDKIFPTTATSDGKAENAFFNAENIISGSIKCAKPQVFIPVFPGTNCEYDTAKAFERAGAKAEIFIIKNRSAADIENSVSEMVKLIDNSQIIAFPGGFSGGDEPDGSGKFIATTFRNPKVLEAVENLLYKRDGLAIGICNGFQALIKLGLVPSGKIQPQQVDSPTLTFNNISRHISTIVKVRVATNKSPWLSKTKVGEIYNVPVSHGEGKFIADDKAMAQLIKNGQIATQYVDFEGNATMQSPFNPNGSFNAVEGIISPDGRILGKMGHTERYHRGLYINIDGSFDMKLFEGGVEYFK